MRVEALLDGNSRKPVFVEVEMTPEEARRIAAVIREAWSVYDYDSGIAIAVMLEQAASRCQ